jgi:hypothetical protein
VARNKAQLGELLDGKALWLFTKSAMVHVFSDGLVSYGPLPCRQAFHLPLPFLTDVSGYYMFFLEEMNLLKFVRSKGSYPILVTQGYSEFFFLI